MSLTVHDLTTTIEGKKIIEEVNFSIETKEFAGIVGPNGSGKSTLLKTIYRIYDPLVGIVKINDMDTKHLTHRDFAKEVAVVSQESGVPFDFTVREIALMGRSPHKRFFEKDHEGDEKIVKQALSEVGLAAYSDRSFTSLSGGEKQRVIIARALAQHSKMLILDEPTNHLDIHHQLHMLDVVSHLNITVVAALHDLNLAAAYCDKIFVMQEGKLVASGSPEDVLTEQLLQDVFKVNGTVTTHPLTGKVQILYNSARMHTQQKIKSGTT